MSRPLHLALAQFTPRKGNYAANLDRVGRVLAQAAALDPRPDVVQLPETALTGYFVEGAVRDLAVSAGTLARDLNAAYLSAAPGAGPLDVIVGFYETWQSTLHNSAMYVTLAAAGDDGPPAPVVRHVHRKHFLPTYGMFDEERFVERGFDLRAFDAPWGRAAMLVCEDAWHSLTGVIAALDGAQVVFVCAAAPARGIWPRDDGIPGPASVARWERLVRDIAEEHGVFVALANMVGSEGGKSFGGSSTVCGPRGDVRARAAVWEEALLSVTVDLADLSRARADSPLLNDLRTSMPHLLRMLDQVERGMPAVLSYDPPTGETAHGLVRDAGAVAGRETDEGKTAGGAAPARGAPPSAGSGQAPRPQHASPARDAADHSGPGGLPVARVASDAHGLPPSLDIDPRLLEEWLVHFIRDELGRRGFTKAVLGLSGGVDSAVAAYLAERALGAENVVAVRMPYRTSSPESLAHAQLVVDALRIESRTLDISAAVDGYLAHEPDADAARRGNVMARTRMIALFDLSARYRALPLGTGNKTERLLGYFTWHADDSPPVNPLGDLFKTQVWALARHLGVPEVIVGKPASADLVAGQTDEGDFGISYARADVILNWLLYGHSAADLATLGFAAEEVELVRRRLDGTHWKRRMPTVAMVSPTAIGESYLRPVDY